MGCEVEKLYRLLWVEREMMAVLNGCSPGSLRREYDRSNAAYNLISVGAHWDQTCQICIFPDPKFEPSVNVSINSKPIPTIQAHPGWRRTGKCTGFKEHSKVRGQQRGALKVQHKYMELEV